MYMNIKFINFCYPEIDVHEHEIYKFLLISNEILETSLNDATDLTDSEDSKH